MPANPLARTLGPRTLQARPLAIQNHAETCAGTFRQCPGEASHATTALVKVYKIEREESGLTWIIYTFEYTCRTTCREHGHADTETFSSGWRAEILDTDTIGSHIGTRLCGKLRRHVRHLLARASGAGRRPRPEGFCAGAEAYGEVTDEELEPTLERLGDTPSHVALLHRSRRDRMDAFELRLIRRTHTQEPRFFRALRGRVDDLRLYGRVRCHVDRRRITPNAIDG